MSSRQLDVLLAQAREPEPVDDGFAASVMRDIESLDVVAPSRLAALRRPLVAITATAVVLTGGAVAALVGTQIVSDDDDAGTATGDPRASVSVSSAPEASSADEANDAQALATADAERSSALDGSGHIVSVVDPNTGLRLQTETYTNEFTTGTPQRVTLTLENTSEKPLAITGYKDCSLQVMAFPMNGSAPADDEQAAADYYERYRNESGVEWVCAGSSASPRVPTAAGTVVLQPGATQSTDAMLTLSSNGNWGVMGMCRCEVTEADAPAPKENPFGDFTNRVLPSPLITLDIDTSEGTITPPIRVRATS